MARPWRALLLPEPLSAPKSGSLHSRAYFRQLLQSALEQPFDRRVQVAHFVCDFHGYDDVGAMVVVQVQWVEKGIRWQIDPESAGTRLCLVRKNGGFGAG